MSTAAVLRLRAQATGRRLLISALALALLMTVTPGCGDDSSSPPRKPVLALVGGTVHSSPGAAPIEDGVVLVEEEHITTVGSRASVPLPEGAIVLDTTGQTMMAGFWNSHVHFFGPPWDEAPTMSANELEQRVENMLTRHGFVHVFDTGSFSEITMGIRQRIHSGEVKGPDILTTGLPLVPIDGTPVYVGPIELPEPRTPDEARELVRQTLAQGADGIKLFTVSNSAEEPYPVMAQEIASAAVEEAHAQGKPVLAHPTALQGVTIAATAGVDILVHTAPEAGPLPDSLHLQMSEDMALIPTLFLWELELRRQGVTDEDVIRAFVGEAVGQLARHAELGGRVLFGTDVGYTSDDDPHREYALMSEAGLSFSQILASLTSEPAAEFGRGERTGRLETGFDADMVVVDGDPTANIEALADVRLVLKRGQLIYEARQSNSRQSSTGSAHRLRPTLDSLTQ